MDLVVWEGSRAKVYPGCEKLYSLLLYARSLGAPGEGRW
jgi:hypothetical protein